MASTAVERYPASLAVSGLIDGAAGNLVEHRGKRMTVGVKRRILVVDDDEDTRRSLEVLLTKAGYEVIQASNGSEGLRVWRDHGGDLVIMDLLMPEKSGIETIVELLAYSPGTRIIAMSGGGDSKRFDLLGQAGMLGAVLTIRKPFSSAEMTAAVERALNGPN